MNFSTIVKLLQGNNLEDSALVLEYLKKEFPDNIPSKLALFLWYAIREDVLKEYCSYKNADKYIFQETIKWKKL